MPGSAHGSLSAAKTGYVNALAPASDGVELRLTKGGVISGHVLDDEGAPLPLMGLVALRVGHTGGRTTFARAAGVETDDHGEYRLFGLPAGEFVIATAGGMEMVSAGPAPDRPLSHYYPHASTPEEAQVIRVAAGGEVPGMDLVVPLPEPGPQFPRSSSGPVLPSLGTIRGRIVNADGLPMRLRRVALDSADGTYGPYLAVTDHNGRYELHNLPAGRYRLSARDLGAVSVAYGQRGPTDQGSIITVKPGADVGGIDVTIPRAARIAGRVVDEYGDPMERASVRVYRIAQFKGRRSLVNLNSTSTNDLGRFSLSGLSPGRYLISAAVGQAALPIRGDVADWPGYARTYYPGTPVPNEAQPIEVGPDQDALNVDLTLMREHGARISGTAYTAAGKPLEGQVSLALSQRSGALALPPVTLRIADGRFAFDHLAPGEYVLQAAAPRGSVTTESEFASQFVTLNGDDAVVAMRLSAGSTIEGRLTFEGADPPEDPDLRLSATPADPDLRSLTDDPPARADVHADLTFQIGGLNGPRRLQLTQAPDGWTLKQVLVNGGDATDMAIPFGTPDQSLRDVEVVLTKLVTTLTAAARNATDRGPDFRFIAFAADPARRYPGSRFVALGVPDGHATTVWHGLPPGEYYVAAIARGVLDGTGTLDDPGFLEALVGGATKATLTEGERRSVSVNVIDR